MCYQNAGQGLGFKVAWSHRQEIHGGYAAKLYTALTAVVAALLSFEVERLAASTRDNEFALSSVQASSIQATVALFRNSSCVYNMTVDSILGAM